jgi:hypothetical protein
MNSSENFVSLSSKLLNCIEQKEETCDVENETDTAAEPISQVFLEEHKEINKDKSQMLFDYLTQVTTQASFVENAWKLKWIYSMLEHIAMEGSDLDDATESLYYYISRKYDSSFTLASESCGYPWVKQI